MRKPILLAVVAALVLVVFPVGSAGADSPFEHVSLEVETKLGPGGPSGPFTASGDAEKANLICDSGWGFDTGPGKFSPRMGNENAVVQNIQAEKIFVCGAGSVFQAADAWEMKEGDGFVMRLQLHFGKKGGFINWVIVDGWGAYAGIAGNGKGTSEGNLIDGVTDMLTGKVR